MKPDESVIEKMVQRIVTDVNPLQILLFGSSARDEMQPDSDLDILVVMPDGSNCLSVARKLYLWLFDLEYPKDIIVVLQSDIGKYGENPCLVLHDALKEGKELYHAA